MQTVNTEINILQCRHGSDESYDTLSWVWDLGVSTVPLYVLYLVCGHYGIWIKGETTARAICFLYMKRREMCAVWMVMDRRITCCHDIEAAGNLVSFP